MNKEAIGIGDHVMLNGGSIPARVIAVSDDARHIRIQYVTVTELDYSLDQVRLHRAIPGPLECAEAQIAALTARIADLTHKLGNLLARIHGDGGQYLEEHGLDKAACDAHEVWAALQNRLAEAEQERDAALPECIKSMRDFMDQQDKNGQLEERLRVARELFDGIDYEICEFMPARPDGINCIEKINQRPDLGGEPCSHCRIRAWLAALSDPTGSPVDSAPGRTDTERLDWLLKNRHMSVSMSSQEGGYAVWDQSRGLTIAGEGNSQRSAIDAAMNSAPGERTE